MKFDTEIIREIQLANFKSLKKLDEICRRHDISYWVAYGTLIGTIRHKGFIPWDDDLDVGMLWDDFQKLCAVDDSEWGDECIFLYGEDDDMRHDKLFGRVYLRNSVIQSRTDVEHWKNPETGKSWTTSCMCDIFVYDRIPDDDNTFKLLYDKMEKISHQFKLTKLQCIMSDRSPVGRAKYAIKNIYRAGVHMAHSKPWVYYYAKCRKLIDRYPKGTRIGSYYAIDPSIYEDEDIFPIQYAQFEDMMVPVPNHYDKILRDFYGDYMSYPPEEDRLHINFVYVDLGNGTKFIPDPMPNSRGAEELAAHSTAQ